MYDEIREVFQNDINQKKLVGYKHSKTGGIRTPYDIMKPTDKRKLIQKVEISNMFETIIPKEEFETKTKTEQKNMLTYWRTKYSNKEIMLALDVKSQGGFAALLKDLGVPLKTRGGSRRGNVKKEVSAAAAAVPAIEIVGGLKLEYNGCYDSVELGKILTKLQLLTDGEENKFIVTIQLKESL